MENNNEEVNGNIDGHNVDSGIDSASVGSPDISSVAAMVEVKDTLVEDEKPVIEKRPPSTNTIQDFEVFSPRDKDFKMSDITLALASDNQARTAVALDAIPNIDVDDSKPGREWINIVRAATYTVPYKDYFTKTVERQEASFRQTVASERGPLAASQPKFKEKEGTSFTGEKAVLRMQSLLGMGGIIQIPLWHSGFWITFKAPTEAAMLELNRRIADEKIALGRQTYGLAFANTSVIFAGHIMDFAMNHIYETSIKEKDGLNIREKISSLDIPLIAWGLACIIWPRGFAYARAVMDASGEQNKIIREKINVGKLLWTDTSALTPWQIAHMASRHGGNMTTDSLDRYRNEFTRGQGRTLKLSDVVSVELRVPNLDQYLTSGQAWVNNIVSMVDRAFGLPPDEDVRNEYIRDQGKATNMRQYSHWCKSIVVGEDVTEDQETLDKMFDALSSDDGIRDAYFAGIKDYMEDATISIVAVPTLEEEGKMELPRFPHLLPLDAMSVFFILLGQKVNRIQART